MELSKHSKVQYEDVANILKRHYSYVNWTILMKDFSIMFSADNDRFDEKKFRVACIPEVLRGKEVNEIES